ncbi:hypothetical protein ABEB36_006596 [Hypothenemus hampei]|uniref:C2H2-type domain-containing protein n=1 Tax=Hypothenemus hampei TaxID=57062 RepID=A0ABD1ERL1_HYPHA
MDQQPNNKTNTGGPKILKIPDLIPINYHKTRAKVNLNTGEFDMENNNNLPVPKCRIISDHKISISAPATTNQSVSWDNIVFKDEQQTSESTPMDGQYSLKIEKPSKRFKKIEIKEKLFIRLVRLDISKKLAESNEQSYKSGYEHRKFHMKKGSKLELQKLNINKTESVKMEELLLKKFKKNQEKQQTGNQSSTNEDNCSDFEPYVYKKTTKSVYETYKPVTNEKGEITLQCLLCPFVGDKFKKMSLHYKFKHKLTPIEEMNFCNVKGCQFKTVHRGMLKWHMKRHSLAADKIVTEEYPCNQCGKIFGQRKGYLIHLKHTHKEENTAPKTDFPCATCNFRTNSQQNLQAHIYRSHVPDELKPCFKCNICGYDTHYKEMLKKHLNRVHLAN